MYYSALHPNFTLTVIYIYKPSGKHCGSRQRLELHCFERRINTGSAGQELILLEHHDIRLVLCFSVVHCENVFMPLDSIDADQHAHLYKIRLE